MVPFIKNEYKEVHKFILAHDIPEETIIEMHSLIIKLFPYHSSIINHL